MLLFSVKLTTLVILILGSPISTQRQYISISPQNGIISEDSRQTITCSTTEDLTNDCQFIVRDDDHNIDYPILDAPIGVVRVPQGRSLRNVTSKFVTGTYTTQHTTDGVCVLRLGNMRQGRYLVGCRLRPARRGLYDIQREWRYGLTALSVVGDAIFLLEQLELLAFVNDNKLLHQKGEPVEILCKTLQDEVLLTRCLFALPGQSIWTLLPRKRKSTSLFATSSNEPEYFGSGIDVGHCGCRIPRVQDSHNGMFWCEAMTSTHVGRMAISVIVARAPTNVQFEHGGKLSYNAGDTLTANCSVNGGNPAPIITWYLGGKIYRGKVINDLQEGWRWPWAGQNITQIVTFTIEEHHHRQELSCWVEHPSLNTPSIYSFTIIIGGKMDIERKVEESNLWTIVGATIGVTAAVTILVASLVVVYCRRMGRLNYAVSYTEPKREPAHGIGNKDDKYLYDDATSQGVQIRPDHHPRESNLYDSVGIPSAEYLEVLPPKELAVKEEGAAEEESNESNLYSDVYDHVFRPNMGPKPATRGPLPLPPAGSNNIQQGHGSLQPRAQE